MLQKLEAEAGRGSADAMCRLGQLWASGELHPHGRDADKALEWFSKALKLGHRPAMVGAGRICYYGCKTKPVNHNMAREYYLKAIEKGHDEMLVEAEDQYCLGMLLVEVLGGWYPRGCDLKQGLRWLHKVADDPQPADAKSRAMAQTELGMIYLLEQPYQIKDLKLAQAYLEKVAGYNSYPELAKKAQNMMREHNL
jgi:TPR repeat protein